MRLPRGSCTCVRAAAGTGTIIAFSSNSRVCNLSFQFASSAITSAASKSGERCCGIENRRIAGSRPASLTPTAMGIAGSASCAAEDWNDLKAVAEDVDMD